MMDKPQLAPHEKLIEYPGLNLQIVGSLNIPEERLEQNIRSALKRGLPQVWPHKPQDTVLAICAGGPSLLDHIEDIKDLAEGGVKVVALANTMHVLLEHGIRPSAQVLLDGKPRNAEFIVAVPDCKYFVASQCDPVVFDRLEELGCEAILWHSTNTSQGVFEETYEHYDAWIPVTGGPTIALRSFRLFEVLGYQRFHVFGMDSCLMDGKHHAYEQPDADDFKTMPIHCNGEEFRCTGWMVQQAMEFMKLVKSQGQGWEMQVHGDGLIATMIRG